MKDNIIYYDINESDYVYKFNNYDFYFSSKFYLGKFTDEIKDYVRDKSLKMNNLYEVKIDSEEMLLFSLYKKIEKRGFKILYNNKPLNQDTIFRITVEV